MQFIKNFPAFDEALKTQEIAASLFVKNNGSVEKGWNKDHSFFGYDQTVNGKEGTNMTPCVAIFPLDEEQKVWKHLYKGETDGYSLIILKNKEGEYEE